ncbi:MAG: alpha/beta fold hydrolase [Pseudomonadota bacterium]
MAADRLADMECPAHEITGTVSCHSLSVAENPAVVDGRRIPIRLMVLAATGNTVEPDPLVIIPGGPGQSAIAATNLRIFFSNYFAPIREHRDIVLVDQRGVGGSNPLALQPSADTLFVRTDVNLPPEWGRAALPSLQERADLRQYTTARAVTDLDAVRNALSAERINLYATSYGTRVAQYYIKRYGDRVRTAILKGVSPPDDNIVLSYGRKPQQALNKLFAMCVADAVCNDAYPDLGQQLDAVLDRLAKEPVTVNIEHPITGEPATFQITRGNFAFGVRTQMMNAFAFARLPQLIAAANGGEFDSWAQFLPRVPALYAAQLYGGMTFSVIATEDVPRATQAAVTAEAESTLIGAKLAKTFLELQSFWPAGEAPDDLFAPLRSNVPILLVSGALDPATPPEGAAAMLPGLPNSRHIIFPGGSHSAANFDGLDQIMADFISEGSVGHLDLSAATMNRPLAFDIADKR